MQLPNWVLKDWGVPPLVPLLPANWNANCSEPAWLRTMCHSECCAHHPDHAAGLKDSLPPILGDSLLWKYPLLKSCLDWSHTPFWSLGGYNGPAPYPCLGNPQRDILALKLLLWPVEAASQQVLSCLTAPPGPLLHDNVCLGSNLQHHGTRGAVSEKTPEPSSCTWI